MNATLLLCTIFHLDANSNMLGSHIRCRCFTCKAVRLGYHNGLSFECRGPFSGKVGVLLDIPPEQPALLSTIAPRPAEIAQVSVKVLIRQRAYETNRRHKPRNLRAHCCRGGRQIGTNGHRSTYYEFELGQCLMRRLLMRTVKNAVRPWEMKTIGHALRIWRREGSALQYQPQVA